MTNEFLIGASLSALLIGCASGPTQGAGHDVGAGSLEGGSPIVMRPNSPAEILESMDWLSGAWSQVTGDGKFEAHYGKPAGGMLLSYSFHESGGQVTFEEFEVFECTKDGVILRPYPGGSPAARFAMTSYSQEDRKAIFESPANEFPSRITYELTTAGKLNIYLDDPHGGSDQAFLFAMSPVASRD